MDIKTLLNRAKTRFRYWLVSDLPIKKLIPTGIRHRFSGKVIDALATHTDVPAPYIPGKYPKGINLYGFFKAENGRHFIADKLSMEHCAEAMKKRISQILQ